VHEEELAAREPTSISALASVKTIAFASLTAFEEFH